MPGLSANRRETAERSRRGAAARHARRCRHALIVRVAAGLAFLARALAERLIRRGVSQALAALDAFQVRGAAGLAEGASRGANAVWIRVAIANRADGATRASVVVVATGRAETRHGDALASGRAIHALPASVRSGHAGRSGARQ